MKKIVLRFSLMTALVCGLSMSFVACSDDDDDNNSANEVMAGELSDDAVKAWTWLSVLTDADEQVANWQNKTYTATIGEQSSNNPMARLIYVSDLNDAKANFANIAGCKPEELSGTKTVSAGEFGTMTWNVSAQGAQNIATVDVNSALMPQLQQIVFCTEDQAPDNAAAINGNCYYRLGDVIEDQDGFYWVCVQPSFLGKKNKDSYWVNVFNANPNTGKGRYTKKVPGLPDKFIYSKYNKKYNDNTIMLPTCLKMDRKQNYNLGNLLWAVLDPKGYKEDVSINRTGLVGVDKEYYDEVYVTDVYEDWVKKDVFGIMFNTTPEVMSKLESFNFFYNGYHWKVGSTAGVWIYRSECFLLSYAGCADDDDTLFEMKTKGYGFDIRRYVGDPNQDKACASTNAEKMAPSKQIEENKAGYWVIRVATGKQLYKNYDPYKKMDNMHNISIFNLRNNIDVGENTNVPVGSELSQYIEKRKNADPEDEDDFEDEDEPAVPF